MRVRKTTGGVSVDYLYDLAGNVVTELNTSGGWTRKEIFAGRHVATYKDGPTGQTYFSHPDWLGTERARTDKNGAVTETCTNLPFGDAQTCTGTSVSPLHFTGKQRDTETDNDYFGARYYVSRQGRWLTPDWSARGEAVPYASLGNPQTLNLYAYVGNNPVSSTDADGHMIGPIWAGFDRHRETLVKASSSLFSVEALPGGDVGQAVSSSGTLTSAKEVMDALADPLPQQQEQTLSSQGLDFIARHEAKPNGKPDLTVQPDIYGNPTIGYGHLVRAGEDFSKGITLEQAKNILAKDAKDAVTFVNKHNKSQLSQSQFDALVDVAFNSPRAAGKLQNKVNNSEKISTRDFVNTLPKGTDSPLGLINRRTHEANLFLNGDYGGPH